MNEPTLYEQCLDQLHQLTSDGIRVMFINKTYYKVICEKTWFYVDFVKMEITDSGGHGNEIFIPSTLCMQIVIRHFKIWQKELIRENIYTEPHLMWARLYTKFKLPYKLAFSC